MKQKQSALAYPYQIKSVQQAQIEWNEKTALSTQFDDIYFSNDDGIAETEYVFLKQNHLPEDWLHKDQFSVLETGFGTGLNFFCTLDLWFKTAGENACLTYISVEKYPLNKTDFERQKQCWPQFSDYIDQVSSSYPPMLTGMHSCSLFNGRVKLLLIFGDACEQLSTLTASVDVCFLDGFAPSKNQSMWTPDLFSELARLIKPGGRLSTFTAVGDVRRGLNAAGFEMSKADAFGKKRHMLSGVLRCKPEHSLFKPWFKYPENISKRNEVIVIGAGIAGLTTAIALFEAGYRVTVLEQAAAVASGASGNLAGVVMPRIDKQQNAESRFYWYSFFTALRHISRYQQSDLETGWRQSGVLQRLKDISEYTENWPDDFFSKCSAQDIKHLTGIEMSGDVLAIAQAGFITPKAFCENLLDFYKDRIDFQFGEQVVSLSQSADVSGSVTGWSVETTKNRFVSSNVVICNAASANAFSQTKHLTLQAVRGQVSYLKSDIASQLNTVVCDKSYAIAVNKQQLLIGATFKRDDNSCELRTDEHRENVQQTALMFDDMDLASELPMQGRASIRAMTADRLPMVGAVPDYEYYQRVYKDLAKGRKESSYDSACYHQGLYINTGHGSRGLTSSFLSAEIITAMVSGQTIPVDTEILSRLHPARFMIKQLLSGKTTSK